MPLALLVASLLAAGFEEQQAQAFEEKVLAEVSALAPQAREEARAAGQAHRDGRWQEAFDGYARVLAQAPRFPHALRRQCRARLGLGDRAGGLALCRAALEAAATAENQMALADALTLEVGAAKPTPAELAQGASLARQAFERGPADFSTAASACQVALRAEQLDLLHRAADRLQALAPGQLATAFCGFFAALTRERYGEARAQLRVAREAGLAPRVADDLAALADRAEPAWSRWGGLGLWVVGGWATALVALLLAGVALSAATLRGAPRLAADRSPGQRSGSRLRATYRAVLWLTCAVYYLSLPLVALLVLAAGYGLWLLFAAIGRIPVKLALLAGLAILASLWAVARSLWASLARGKAADPGLRLDVATEPRFHEALREAAGRVGTRPVDTVFLTPGTDAAVYEQGGMGRQLSGRTERCLILGVALLEGMTQGQLKAVLAHEYGHFVNRDTAGGGLALAVRRSVLQMAESLASGGAAAWYNPAWLFVTNFHRLFLRVSQGASRLQEILADRWAALAYGGGRFAAGLTHAISRSVAFDRHASATLREVIDGNLGLRNLYRYTPATPTDAGEVAAEVATALAAEPSPYDSHPRPADRIAWAGDLPSANPDGAGDDLPAWELFADREALELQLTDEVRANVAARHGVQIPAEAKAAEPTPAAS